MALPTGAFAYWQAPNEPGATTVTFQIKDDIGQKATFHPTVRLFDGNGKLLGESSIQLIITPQSIEYLPLPDGLIPEGD